MPTITPAPSIDDCLIHAMALELSHAVHDDNVDLADPRSVVVCLRRGLFSQAAVELLHEAATEEARRMLQATARNADITAVAALMAGIFLLVLLPVSGAQAASIPPQDFSFDANQIALMAATLGVGVALGMLLLGCLQPRARVNPADCEGSASYADIAEVREANANEAARMCRVPHR